MNSARIRKLVSLIKKHKIDALLITNPVSLRYFTGFGEEGCLALFKANSTIILACSKMLYHQVCSEVKGGRVRVVLQKRLGDIVKAGKIKSLGFEQEYVSVGALGRLRKMIPRARLVGLDLVEQIRTIKDKVEIRLLRRSAHIVAQSYRRLLSWLNSGVSEFDLARKASEVMIEKGAEGVSFDPVIAFGSHGAFAHHVPSDKRFSKGAIALIDMGCTYKRYASDVTRTLVKGKGPSRKLKSGRNITYQEVYRIVLASQTEAIKKIKPGVPCRYVDKVARNVIEEAGLGEYFVHSTGHGIGMSVHERPSLAPKSKDVLLENMVVTVEPGVYIPGWGGVRIEDMVLVTKRGHKVLSEIPK
ncbi:MAG: Xaa-Pro peptidase family protein [bacterium]